MSKQVLLVTGANGQLGNEIRALAGSFDSISPVFLTRDDLPLHQPEQIKQVLERYRPAFCINGAAYTAVDKAETEKELALQVNANAVGQLAIVCRELNTKFVHISTDYVFNGQSSTPYKETDPVDPVNTYGASKLKGEQLCLQNDPDAIIIRTAWVYSRYGHNFVKTMLRLMKERNEINVVNDQFGAPTWAADLASCILHMIDGCIEQPGKWQPGIYHFSNQGRINWYEFAVAIKELSGMSCTVHPIPTSQYPTPARRPSFSLLDTQKIRDAWHCIIPEWKDSLRNCLNSYNSAFR